MTWISGPCHDEPDPEPRPERRLPRMVWGQATHYAGIVDTINPGHFEPEPRTDDGEADPTDPDD